MTTVELTRTPLITSCEWVGACPLSWIVPGSGVSALVRAQQVAIFRLADDRLFALDNLDPFSGAQVLSRGIVGDRAGVPMVSSPMYRHAFDLVTGRCLDDASVRLTTYPLRVVDGIVYVGSR